MTPAERVRHYAPLLDAVADLEGRGPDPLPSPEPAFSAWGTPVESIDTDEYCPSCERDNREGHYENCTL